MRWFYRSAGKRTFFCPFWLLHGVFVPVPCDGKSCGGLYPWRLPSGNLLCSSYSDSSGGLGIERRSLCTTGSGCYFSYCHRRYGGSAAQRIADRARRTDAELIKQRRPRRLHLDLRCSFFVKKTTTGYACGIKKAMPMSRNDKPPTIQ